MGDTHLGGGGDGQGRLPVGNHIKQSLKDKMDIVGRRFRLVEEHMQTPRDRRRKWGRQELKELGQEGSTSPHPRHTPVVRYFSVHRGEVSEDDVLVRAPGEKLL